MIIWFAKNRRNKNLKFNKIIKNNSSFKKVKNFKRDLKEIINLIESLLNLAAFVEPHIWQDLHVLNF